MQILHWRTFYLVVVMGVSATAFFGIRNSLLVSQEKQPEQATTRLPLGLGKGVVQELNELKSRVANLRHYHGVVDVTPEMPASVDLHFVGNGPTRVRMALRGDRFSPTHYTEMPQHSHNHELKVAYAQIAFGENANSGDLALIVSADWVKMNDKDHAKGYFVKHPRKDEPLIREFNPMQGQSGIAPRAGGKYEWANNLQISVESNGSTQSITEQILKKINKNKKWESFGDGCEGGFNGNSSGLVDITELVKATSDESEVVTITFTLASSGGKLHYDILCD